MGFLIIFFISFGFVFLFGGASDAFLEIDSVKHSRTKFKAKSYVICALLGAFFLGAGITMFAFYI